MLLCQYNGPLLFLLSFFSGTTMEIKLQSLFVLSPPCTLDIFIEHDTLVLMYWYLGKVCKFFEFNFLRWWKILTKKDGLILQKTPLTMTRNWKKYKKHHQCSWAKFVYQTLIGHININSMGHKVEMLSSIVRTNIDILIV